MSGKIWGSRRSWCSSCSFRSSRREGRGKARNLPLAPCRSQWNSPMGGWITERYGGVVGGEVLVTFWKETRIHRRQLPCAHAQGVRLQRPGGGRLQRCSGGEHGAAPPAPALPRHCYTLLLQVSTASSSSIVCADIDSCLQQFCGSLCVACAVWRPSQILQALACMSQSAPFRCIR